eukprot:gene19882-21823_t
MSVVLSKRAAFCSLQSRGFYMWINVMFNRKDEKRVKEIGPDRTAAEWILRNGGSVCFAGYDKSISNYNLLPMGSPAKKYQLEKINARGINLTDNGFEHLVGLKYLKHLDMNSCCYITDLTCLKEVAESLQYLDIGNCESIADISPIEKLRELRTLVLTNTLGKNRYKAIDAMKIKLPGCEIIP